jgi:hypothetical protein
MGTVLIGMFDGRNDEKPDFSNDFQIKPNDRLPTVLIGTSKILHKNKMILLLITLNMQISLCSLF